MDDQLSMLDIGRPCQFPQLSGASGYRYGCRCARCRTAHQDGKHPDPQCEIEGCTNLRLKGTRRCADHPRATTTIKKLSNEPCELCGQSHTWYESSLRYNTRDDLKDLYRRTCAGCRQRYMGVIKAHRMNTLDAMRLIMATNCELCGNNFSITQHGRTACHVDHDHACCPGERSCGHCIRGILCPRCNKDVGLMEQLGEQGIRRAFEYIERWNPPAQEAHG